MYLPHYLTMERINMSSPILPPGFRFHPTDQELIVHYLKKKVSSSSNSSTVSMIADVDLYKFNPWELPVKAYFGESEWFFFSPRDRKYPNGARPNRTAASGYWKATGTDKPILTSSGTQCLGVKKALVFYIGRPPKGEKTNWMMQEYRLLDNIRHSQRLRGSMRLDDWVLCRVRQKCNGSPLLGENLESSSGSSSPFPVGRYFNKEEEIMKNYKNLLKDTEVQFQANSLMFPQGSEVADEQHNLDSFHGGGSSENSTSDVNSDYSQTLPMVSSFKDALESIKRELSIGALDELDSIILPPNMRLNSSTTTHYMDINAIKHFSSTFYS